MESSLSVGCIAFSIVRGHLGIVQDTMNHSSPNSRPEMLGKVSKPLKRIPGTVFMSLHPSLKNLKTGLALVADHPQIIARITVMAAREKLFPTGIIQLQHNNLLSSAQHNQAKLSQSPAHSLICIEFICVCGHLTFFCVFKYLFLSVLISSFSSFVLPALHSSKTL